jgi:hypothetical protein
MKSTNMAFDDAFAHVIAEIGGGLAELPATGA